jgi:hypothetical protein
VRLKLQPSATVVGSSKGELTMKFGKMIVAYDVDHRRWVDGAREVSHAAPR